MQHNLLNILNAGKYLYGEEECDVLGNKGYLHKGLMTMVDDRTGQEYYLSPALKGINLTVRKSQKIDVSSLHTEAEGKILAAVSGSLALEVTEESMFSDVQRASWGHGRPTVPASLVLLIPYLRVTPLQAMPLGLTAAVSP